jgi:P-type Ca2+ transporter type 2C
MLTVTLRCSAQATLQHFRTTPSKGLSSIDVSALRETHGYNELSVATPEPTYIKFLKTIYESPLILLLCASAAISAFVGNVDDAISITVAVLIVLTGVSHCFARTTSTHICTLD